jgi:gas vesicle protein
VNEHSRVIVGGAVIGAIVGAAAGYLFFTDNGRTLRERLEPAIDEVRREFMRFQSTIEKVGALANDGMRVVNEFNAARSQYSTGQMSH